MNKWLHSILVVGVTMLMACATHSNPTGKKVHAPKKLAYTTPAYRQDAPNRYIVRRGDTLWAIAQMFLKNPGRWKEIWHKNPQIKNPDLIYPGDIISYITVGGARKLQVAGSKNPVRNRYTGVKTKDGRPVYHLSPKIQTEYLPEPIPTLPKEVVYPFMTKTQIFTPGFAEDYPYIINQGDESYLSLGSQTEIYARSDNGDFDNEYYDVFREKKALINPTDKSPLGIEAVYVGQLRMVKPANTDGIATFVQTDSVNPLYPKDILIPSHEAVYGGDLNFLPKLGKINEDAVVVQPIQNSGSRYGSQFSTVLINHGNDDGLTPGDVFKIVRGKARVGKGRNGESFQLPDKEVATAIVYKVFDSSSYALVMNAADIIYPGDRVLTP